MQPPPTRRPQRAGASVVMSNLNEELQLYIPLVKDHKTFEAIKDYATHRIEFFKTRLETEKDLEVIRGHQACIKEMKKLIGLQDEVKTKQRERSTQTYGG